MALGRHRSIFTFATLRGAPCMIFFISAFAHARGVPLFSISISKMVSIQAAKDAAKRSVGEKASPFPWLSIGASVSILAPEGWQSSKRFCPFEVICMEAILILNVRSLDELRTWFKSKASSGIKGGSKGIAYL